MLTITIKGGEAYDKKNQEFKNAKDTTLSLEHSLVSISKWESKWHKPFLSREKRTLEETIDYIKCMTITQNVDPNIYYFLTDEHFATINKYISDSMTATWFSENKNGPTRRNETITSELIYYWMIAFEIPFDCQKWHLNRLLVLIRICNEKNKQPKKLSKREIMSKNAALNAARKKKLGTSG